MRRIQARVLPALDEAYRMAMDPETPAPVRARLLVDLMDRAGLKPTDVHALVTPETAAPDLDDGIRAALAARGLLPGGQALDEDHEDQDDADEDEDDDAEV